MSSTSTTSRPAMSMSRSLSRRIRPDPRAYARDGEEVDRAGRSGVRGPGRRGRRRSLQHADEHDTAVGRSVGGRDLAAEPARPARNASASRGWPRARHRSANGVVAERLAQQRRPQLSPEAGAARRASRPPARRRLGVALLDERQDDLLERSPASRSANVRYMRRCRASMPCRMKLRASLGRSPSASSSN